MCCSAALIESVTTYCLSQCDNNSQSLYGWKALVWLTLSLNSARAGLSSDWINNSRKWIRIGRKTETRQREASRAKEGKKLEMVKVCQVTSCRLVCSTGCSVSFWLHFTLLCSPSHSLSVKILSLSHSLLPFLSFPSPSFASSFSLCPFLSVSGLRGAL